MRYSHRDSPEVRDDRVTPADTNPTRCHQHALTNQTSSNITSITFGRDSNDSNDSDSTLTSWTSPTNHFASYTDSISATASAPVNGNATTASAPSTPASAPATSHASTTSRSSTSITFCYAVVDNSDTNSEPTSHPAHDVNHSNHSQTTPTCTSYPWRENGQAIAEKSPRQPLL